MVFDDTPDHLTVEVVHQIYPGLEDPGVARVLRPGNKPRLVSTSLQPVALAASA